MTLSDFYQVHLQGQLDQDDRRWIEVHRLLYVFARGTVSAHCHSLIGLEREQLEDAVQQRLMIKFMERRFACEPGQQFERLLNRAAKNDMIDELRGSRSISAQWTDDRRKEMMPAAAATDDVDPFLTIRESMGPSRFREFAFVRDCILGYFLARRSFPAPSWLKTLGVPHDAWTPVLNAAIFDINTAVRGMAA